jgi:hypothetical protein
VTRANSTITEADDFQTEHYREVAGALSRGAGRGATKTANFHGTIGALIWILFYRISSGLTNVSLSDGLLVVGGSRFQIPVRRI